jgi:hypothetical protein
MSLKNTSSFFSMEKAGLVHRIGGFAESKCGIRTSKRLGGNMNGTCFAAVLLEG